MFSTSSTFTSLYRFRLDAARLIVIGIDGNRHCARPQASRASHRQRILIEGAAAKQRLQRGSKLRAYFHIDNKSIQHDLPYSSTADSTIGLGRRIISCNAAPVATMG